MKLFSAIFFTLFFLSFSAHAQLEDEGVVAPVIKNDSIKGNSMYSKKFDSLILMVLNDSLAIDVNDRNILQFHQNELVQSFYRNLGNISSPVYSLNYSQQQNFDLHLRKSVYSIYDLNGSNIKFYTSKKPLTAALYSNSSKEGQYMNLFHTRNIDSNVNITLELNKYGSFGYFRMQRTNSSHLRISGYANYKKYKTNWYLYYNKNESDENGGIVADSLLEKAEYFNRRTIPVYLELKPGEKNRSSVYNQNRNYGLQYQQMYILNKIKKGDSGTNFNFSLLHNFKYSFDSYTYKDYLPDSLDYTLWTNKKFTSKDSIFSYSKMDVLDNYFALKSGTTNWKNNMNYEVGVGNELLFLYRTKYTTYINNYIKGNAQLNVNFFGVKSNLGIYYKQYLTGFTIGNYHLKSTLNTKLSNINLLVELNSAKTNAPLLYQEFRTNKYIFTNNLNPVFENNLRFQISTKKYLASIFYAQTFNYTYWDSNYNVLQANSINIIGGNFNFEFKFNHYYWRGKNLLQLKLNKDYPVNIPTYVGIQTLSYDNYIFRKAMKASIGIELEYNTVYNAPVYLWKVNQFGYQNSRKQNNMPRLGLFFNYNVKRLRGFIMIDEIQQLLVYQDLIKYNSNAQRINFINQAAPNALLRLGFDWAFIN